MNDSSQPPGMPRWVKALGIVAAILLLPLAVVGIIFGGGHGPGRHGPAEPPPASHTPADPR